MERLEVRDTVSQQGGAVNRRTWRRSSDSVREALLVRGAELVNREGLGLSLSHVSLERVVRDTGMPRASAYRVWTDRALPPQEAFHEDILHRLLTESTGDARRDLTVKAVLRVLSDGDDAPDMERAIASGCDVNLDALAASDEFKVYVAVCAVLFNDVESEHRHPFVTERVRSSLYAGEVESLHAYEAFYNEFADFFGLRLRSGRTMVQFVAVTGALADGLLLRSLFDNVVGKRILDGNDLSLFADAFLGLLERYFERTAKASEETPDQYDP